MLNAEAGTHAVASDPRAWAASLRAVDLCWRRFPYLGMRYGERGLRFTRSDSAWLASLPEFDPPVVAEQVTWLRGLMATRGMPSVLLQTHLDILCDELDAALPSGQAAHAKLRAAAAGLTEARRAHVTDAQLAALAADFDATAGDWGSRLPHTPLLLAAAVADEIDGCPGAVDSLAGWLTDTQRFPAEWRAAVGVALARACADAGVRVPRVAP